VQDTQKITSAITKESEIVIIGTSFIGMELAGALIKKEPKSVTLVGIDEVPFEAILGKDIGISIMDVSINPRTVIVHDAETSKHMKKQGIKFYMKANVEKITPSESNASHAGSVKLKGEGPLPANLVIMGTGVAPATQFLRDSGFELETDGGIVVDEYLRVKGHQNIYAIGDIAHYPQYPDKHQRRVEHWNVAGNQVYRTRPREFSADEIRVVKPPIISPNPTTLWRTLKSLFSGPRSARVCDTSAPVPALTTPTSTARSTSSR
jgi:NADH dehydrogenase FAD-containing subunit